MKNIITIITFIIALSISHQSHAGLLTISVDDAEVGVGESVFVTLAGTGFVPFNGFDLTVGYDTDVFDYMAGSLSSTLDLFGMVENEVAGSGLAISYTNLFGVDSGDFDIAFSLSALTGGSSTLSIGSELFVLDDIFTGAQTELVVNFENGPSLTATDVPEPSVGALMALAGLLVLRRNRKV